MVRGVAMVVTGSVAENTMHCEVREWCSCGGGGGSEVRAEFSN